MKKPRPSLYARHRFSSEVISLAVWLYFHFPLYLQLLAIDADLLMTTQSPASHRKLMLGAIGIVLGDIGTSSLYSFR
jgi:hypothetical protein